MKTVGGRLVAREVVPSTRELDARSYAERLSMVSDADPAAWTSLILLERYRRGDVLAEYEIFARYFGRLTALARIHLSPRLAQRTDPEDVVLSVYRSFFIAARDGRYALNRGGDLWRLLAAITKHKLLRQIRHQSADRRSMEVEVSLDQVDERRLLGRQAVPSAEDAAALADELEQVMAHLDPFGRRVLELRLQGLRILEIADDIGRSERSVRRLLSQIRQRMTEQFDDA
jgi:RNA polymerase sigma factor (sigma-70 family)